jgi:hypothetical protein
MRAPRKNEFLLVPSPAHLSKPVSVTLNSDDPVFSRDQALT